MASGRRWKHWYKDKYDSRFDVKVFAVVVDVVSLPTS